MISFKTDEGGVLQVAFAGAISYPDIIKWLSEFSEIPGLPSKINLIYDLREANLLIDMVKLIQIAKRTEEATERFESVRTVFLIHESKLESYSTLFTFLKSNSKTSRKVFSDEELAFDWLLAGESVLAID